MWDERFEFETHTIFQSDYDILIVIEKGNTGYIERLLRDNIADKYEKEFKHRRYAPPQFIVETVDKVNKELRNSQYFFTDIHWTIIKKPN